MSLSATKKHLIALLADAGNKVIALSGKWGTGKSHLWRAVKAESADARVKAALYVSLFGLASMDQVKLKIVQSAIPKAGESATAWERLQKGWSAASKLLQSFHKGFAAIDEIALLAVPTLLEDRVIVLDDIERKHDKLSVDEVMGFIDEFTQQHRARFILILNSDQLVDRKLWDAFREKVIDQELRLKTSPGEAFDIAAELQPSPYADRVKKIVQACGVTNIRIICKILKAANRILGERRDLSDHVLSRVLPSTVLLAAVHYKGIEDGPDFDFVLNVGKPNVEDRGKKVEELDEAGKLRAKWRMQLQELGIYACDEYERLVVDFLRSGLFDVADVGKVIEHYASEADMMRAKALAHDLHTRAVWDMKASEGELLGAAEALASQAHLLDMYTVSSLHELISDMPGGLAIADSIVDRWIASFRAKTTTISDFDDTFFRRPLHPRIRAALDEMKEAAQAKTTVFEACEYIVKHSGWGPRQETTMKAATVADFEATIASLGVEDLQLFMCRFIEMCVQRETYVKHFGSAMDNFTQACRNLAADAGQPRLAALVRLLFKDAKIDAELEGPSGPA